MDELKRQLIEAVAALDAHDVETHGLWRKGRLHTSAFWDERNARRTELVIAVAGAGRNIAALWKAEESSATPCGAEFAGHVCSFPAGHATWHGDGLTSQRWPVTP